MRINNEDRATCEVCGGVAVDYGRGDPGWSNYPIPLCAKHDVLWSRYAALNLQHITWRLESIDCQLAAYRETGKTNDTDIGDVSMHRTGGLLGLTYELADQRRSIVLKMLAWVKRQKAKEAKL